MSRFLLLWPASLLAWHSFPFAVSSDSVSSAVELILSLPAWEIWRGWGGSLGSGLQGNMKPKEGLWCSTKVAVGWTAPGPHCLQKSGWWCPEAPGFAGHPKNCCPWAVLTARTESGTRGGSAAQASLTRGCVGDTGAFQGASSPSRPCWEEGGFIFGRCQLSSAFLA